IEQFKNLALLDCRNNELTSIPDLEGITSAAKGYGFDLICLGNQLTQLPKLPSNTTMVMAYQNKLSSISSIAQQGNIHILSVGENPNLAIPDLSKMPNLTFLDCRSNNWDTLPNLSNNTLLQMLHINGNNLRNLPDLSSLDSLRFINCAKNKLTFEDLLQIDNPLVRAQDKIKNNFFYILQDTVGSAQNIALVEGGSYVIKLGIDEAVTSNSYTWYKNGQMLTTTNAPELIVNSPGIYTCAVSNSIFTQLVLWSHATTVTAAPWTPVIAGDQNQIMIIPSDVSAIIEGSGLEAGDYIGAFFHSSDNAALICGAQTQWTGVNTTLTLYANTSVTNKNGFDPNEAFVIKVWKTAKQKEYLVNAQYRTDSAFAQGFYASNAVVKVSSLHFAACQGQTLSLYKGWNLISLNVIPDNNHMSSLFNGIGPLVVKNAAGNIMYAPQNGITSGIWNTQEGYLVYVSQNHVLSVCGTAIDPNTTIAIPQQNYPYFLPYFAKSQRTLSTALSPFIGQLQYVQSMEYAPTANSIVAYNYIPEHVITPAVNEIVNMRPGLAYKVMVNTTIPAFQYSTGDGLRLYDEEKPEVDTSVSRFSKHFGLAAITTGKNSVLVISQALIEPSLSKGDEIAVFAPDHTLVGSAVYTKASVAITLWEHPNMSAGEGYVFKYWKRNENAEGTLELPVTVSKNHVNFKVLNPEVTHMDDLEVSSVAEVTGYPNPASDKFVLNIRCVAPHAAKLVISSAIGTVLDDVTDLNLKVGENELIYSTEGLTNGVYTYQLKIDNEVIRGKFSVAK
ncbi:MAG TPA: hypothetical protein VL947_07875, partial [Cytophagales bacterium]|nr:hypothetical protein [Cytophagales bacterium]